jgi:hypothetical protein
MLRISRLGLYILTRTGAHFARKRFGWRIQQTARLQLVADQPLRHLAVAGFRQRLPEEETLWHLVARHFGGEEAGQVQLRHGTRALARHADGDADLAPNRIGHTEHRDLANRRMGEDLLLDLARIDVGAA